jgi:hypothetical protein
MYVGFKHNLKTALVITGIQLFNIPAEQTTDLSTVIQTIAAGEIVGYDVGNNYFSNIKLLSNVPLDGVVLTPFAKLTATDTWVEIKGITQDNYGDIAVHISTTDMVNALLATQYSTVQLDVINGLVDEQRFVFLTGTATQKKAILNTLTVANQALFTSVPIQFIQTVAQANADTLSLSQITTKLINNQFISDNESVFYALGNSLMATAAMAEIDVGRGFDGLRNIGLTQSQALKVLSIYNVTIETAKYESELSLTHLASNPAAITNLESYLQSLTPPLQLPPMAGYLSDIRANHAVYAAIASWTRT